MTRLTRFGFSAWMIATLAAALPAQQRGGTPQTDQVQPVNSGANPYRVIRDWATLTLEKRPWGGSNGVAVDRDGKSVWATDRCSPGTTPGCLGTRANPVHLFDESGKEIRSFGGGLFVWPHGIHVDRDGNVWVADSRAPSAEDLKKFPGEDKKGSVVVKFSPQGKVLLTLGTPGVRGNPPEALTDPTAVVTDPANGDVYVAESHTDVTDPNLIGRISVFDKTGRFLRVIGKTGTGPGEFRTPHALAFDSQGRLVVADRHNHRIQILTKSGQFIREYDDFGRVSGLALDHNDVLYTADSESTEKVHPGWQRGIRIGSLKDGKVTTFIPAHKMADSPDGAMGEGIAVDAAGNIYTAEANLRGVTKFVPLALAALPPDINPVTLSRLPPVTAADLDEEGRRLLAARTNVKPAPGPTHITAYSPRELDLGIPSGEKSPVGPRYFQLAALIAARESDQQYEWSSHEPMGRRQGLEQSVIDVVKYNRDVAGLSDKDATMITFGRALFRDHHVSSELWQKMMTHFGRQRTVQLMMIMGDYFRVALMLNAVDQHLPPDRPPLLPPR